MNKVVCVQAPLAVARLGMVASKIFSDKRNVRMSVRPISSPIDTVGESLGHFTFWISLSLRSKTEIGNDSALVSVPSSS